MATSPLPTTHDRRVTQPGSATPISNEGDLVTRAQRGDVGAFEVLYRTHSGRVFGICLRMSRDHARATELLQDAFVRAWEKLGSFRGEASFATWLHRIAVNVVLENERKDDRRLARVESEADGKTEAASSRSSWRGSVREEVKGAGDVDLRIDLQDAISGLPPGARRVFILHDVEGFQHNEIAQMTGLAEGTLRAQLHRARRLLMEALER